MPTVLDAAETYANDLRRLIGLRTYPSPLLLAERLLGRGGVVRLPRGARGESKTWHDGEGWTIGVRADVCPARAQWQIALRLAEWCLTQDGAEAATVQRMRAPVASVFLLPAPIMHGETGSVVDVARRLVVPVSAVQLRRGEIERRPTVFVHKHYARVRGDDTGRVPRDLETLRAWAAGDVTPLRFSRSLVDGGTLLAA